MYLPSRPQLCHLFIIFRFANYLRRTKAAIILQTRWRCHRQRSQFLRLRYATLVIQSQYRGKQARLLKKRLLYQAKAIVIQRAVRAFLGRRSFIAVRRKIILLQCCVRRLIAQRELKKLKVMILCSRSFISYNFPILYYLWSEILYCIFNIL